MNYKDAITQLQSSRDFLNYKLRTNGGRQVLLESLVVIKSIQNLRLRYENVN